MFVISSRKYQYLCNVGKYFGQKVYKIRIWHAFIAIISALKSLCRLLTICNDDAGYIC